MFKEMYGAIGFTDSNHVVDPVVRHAQTFTANISWIRTGWRNTCISARSMRYFYEATSKTSARPPPPAKLDCRLPGGKRLWAAVRRPFRR
jgi:hypothetical protein